MELFFTIFFGTYVLEDVALVGALALVQQQKIALFPAFWACFLGIASGDLAVYGIGRLVRSVRFQRLAHIQDKLIQWVDSFRYQGTLTYMIFLSRAIPGTRLPTYLLAGYSGYSFSRFLIYTLISVFGWVLLAFLFGRSIQLFLTDHWFYAAAALVFCIIMIRKAVRISANKWSRRAWRFSFLKWRYFEFWPAWLFYIPIIPRYIYLSLKYRSLYLPFYSNPQINHAGFIGESKWDFYEPLLQSEFSLKTQLINQSEDRVMRINELISARIFNYPFILKPDQGQRGFAVRVIRSEPQLLDYLKEAQFDLLIQEFCDYPNEAGIFYYRYPSEPSGHIFSITDKIFPKVTADGKSSLGDLILQDPRARMIASTYFSRLHDQLDEVPAAGVEVLLASCGNHCQGTIFRNGDFLYTTQLHQAIESIAERFPDFYFGRFDIRYSSVEELRQGRNFRIVELNGAGSEATHIWDAKTTLTEAYTTLFKQWDILFQIGLRIKVMNKIKYKFSLRKFLTDVLSLTKQNKNLSVSS